MFSLTGYQFALFKLQHQISRSRFQAAWLDQLARLRKMTIEIATKAKIMQYQA